MDGERALWRACTASFPHRLLHPARRPLPVTVAVERSQAIAAPESGRRVHYGTLARLMESLMEAKATGELSRRLRVLNFPALLVMD